MNITITLEKLNELNACYEAVEWFKRQKTNDIYELLELAKEENHLCWANWYIVRILDKRQKVQYAIFAAELVIDIYEKHYPNDDRPHKAIEAAKEYLNSSNAAAAAATAAADAATDAAAAADDAAAYAAAAAAADAAAAAAAAAAAYAADAADDARNDTMIAIIEYGLSLLENGNE